MAQRFVAVLLFGLAALSILIMRHYRMQGHPLPGFPFSPYSLSTDADTSRSDVAVEEAIERIERMEKAWHGTTQQLAAGTVNRAYERLSSALATQPETVDGHLLMGILLMQQARFGEARERMAKVLAMHPLHDQAKTGMLSSLLGLHHYEAALRWADWMLERNSEHAEALEGWVIACRALNVPDQALARLTDLAALHPDCTGVQSLLEAASGRLDTPQKTGRNEQEGGVSAVPVDTGTVP